ncbi:bacterial extracellular solute-binding s, 5 Middle family protein, partial [Vibrio parahaemolyticus V-223/04]
HGHLVKIIKRFILSLMTPRNGLMVRRSRPMIMSS